MFHILNCGFKINCLNCVHNCDDHSLLYYFCYQYTHTHFNEYLGAPQCHMYKCIIIIIIIIIKLLLSS